MKLDLCQTVVTDMIMGALASEFNSIKVRRFDSEREILINDTFNEFGMNIEFTRHIININYTPPRMVSVQPFGRPKTVQNTNARCWVVVNKNCGSSSKKHISSENSQRYEIDANNIVFCVAEIIAFLKK